MNFPKIPAHIFNEPDLGTVVSSDWRTSSTDRVSARLFARYSRLAKELDVFMGFEVILTCCARLRGAEGVARIEAAEGLSIFWTSCILEW